MAKRRIWHREDIKAELRKRYGSLTALAKSWGFNRLAVSHALQAPQTRKRMARRVAEALDLTPHDLWPSLFEPEAASNRRLANTTRRISAPEEQNAA